MKPISIQVYRLPATWIATAGSLISAQDIHFGSDWGYTLELTALAASMAVNTLVTGLIVFRILKVFLEVKAASNTSVERNLGSSGGSSKFRHIMFVIIESGMALFAIQLIRIVLTILPASTNTFNLIIGIHQMFNVIIILKSFFFVLLITFNRAL